MTSFLEALIPLVDAFDALGVAYYIGGSVASIAHGVPRTTLDVDVIAEIRPGQVRPLVILLQGGYYVAYMRRWAKSLRITELLEQALEEAGLVT